jgi:hypothetical protein
MLKQIVYALWPGPAAVKITTSIALILVAFLSFSTVSRADVITDWNKIADTAAVTNAKRSPAAALIDMAYVHAAMYDAVNAIDGRYSVYAVAPAYKPAAGTSKESAGASAAYRTLLSLFPGQQAFLDEKYADYLATVPDGTEKWDGIALGTDIASRFLGMRAGDGRDAEVPFTPWTGAGTWQPTPPNSTATPLTPWIATMRPFLIAGNSQFRPQGPPALDSARWIADYNETKQYGSLTGSRRTDEQTQIGLFYTDHTAAQLSRGFRDFVNARPGLNSADSSRLFAMIYLSIADSLIAGFDAKYHFHFWRPVTAISAGAEDLTDQTVADQNWTPLSTTPMHPEYPAAHGCVTAAYAETLRAFYRTKNVRLGLSSTTTNTTRTFTNTDGIISEIIDARIYGGMHYRTSGHAGVKIGKKVTDWMIKHYFKPNK